MIKGKLSLEHEIGLGKKPNVVPPGEVRIDGELRTVEIGWHPVAGSAGKWFAEQTRLGRMITDEIHKCPDPTQHWAVLVGGFVHELWMVRFDTQPSSLQWCTLGVLMMTMGLTGCAGLLGRAP